MTPLESSFDTDERASLLDAVERSAAQVGLSMFVVRVDVVPPVVVFASAQLEQLVGRPAAALIGQPPWELVAPEHRAAVRDLIASRGPGAPPLFHESDVERPDGSRSSVEVGVARIATPTAELAVCYFRDVTGEREMVRALRQSEERFRALIEGAPDGVVILMRGRIVLANPVGARLLGVPDQAAVVGRMIAEFLPAEDAARALERIGRISAGADLGPSEYRVLAEIERHVEIHSIPCEWEGGDGILAFARDVTERRRMQHELERAARLAAVGTMAAAVAHEINNPLTYVQLSLQRLERELGPGQDVLREHVRNAMHGTERVATIVRDLRAFAREDDTPVGPVDVLAVVERAVKMVDHHLAHRARLIRDFSAVPAVEAVASRLEQVVVNLLINAIQAVPSGRPDADEITVTVVATAGRVTIAVRDTGIGIAATDRERVFESFFTTKPPGEGTGLGLAVCKRIVDAMGGTIALTSSDAGTEVVVTLPASTAVAPVVREAIAVVEPRPRLRVLVIDDEPLVRKLITLSLAPHHDVEAAAGGEAALETLGEREFDVILCDLMMPGMSGREVHHHVSERHPGLERRIVIVTGGAFVPRLAAFLDSVDNLKLLKPFTEEQVLAAVTAAASR
jgi:two-component system NtrC family sensor kinase